MGVSPRRQGWPPVQCQTGSGGTSGNQFWAATYVWCVRQKAQALRQRNAGQMAGGGQGEGQRPVWPVCCASGAVVGAVSVGAADPTANPTAKRGAGPACH